MKKIIGVMLIAFLTVLGFAVSSYADEAKIGDMTLNELKKTLGMSAYVQGGLTYNLENPDSGTNVLRTFDQKANTFTVDLGQLIFTKDAPVGDVGYKLKLSAGETAKFIHAAGLGELDDTFDLTEAYIDYAAPVGKGLKFRFGKFVTMHGAEVIEAKDNVNYSRSLLFNFAIPFTHTGLSVSYPVSDAISAGIHVVNGWDNFNDNNRRKTLGLSVSVAPVEQLSMVLNVMNGPEQAGNNSDDRFLVDLVGTVKPVTDLAIILNGDYGTEEGLAADGGKAKWYGVAGIVKYDISDLFSAAVRAEYFNDKDGARTGTIQKVKEITVTPEIRLAHNLIVRPEYRHDWSDQEVFDARHETGTKKSQDTIALGVMYSW